MKKKTLVALAWLISFMSLSAAPITPDQALQRIGKTSAATRSAADLKCVYTLELGNGDAGLYVFQNNADSGYLILSADDVAAPLLGYSDKGKFDENNMSPEMKWWLEEYTREIEYARMTGAETYQNLSTRADKAKIAPLVSTRWNQSNPYNLMTPESDGRHCVTGCVATAMAQVMKYWNYPETGTGTGECTVKSKDGSSHTERMLLNEENFQWTKMLDTYDDSASEDQKLAVAYLMKACGYSVGMNYTSNESGAVVMYVANALVNNFFYNPNIQYCQRSYFTATEWNDIIYEELQAGRPVVYGGQSIDGGHCFVCDGYDSDGYFHFNWGWGGMSDGYFLLNALNPGALGIGANGGGYNFGQEIVRGVQISEGVKYNPNFAQQGNMEAKMSGIKFTLSAGENGGWFNMDTNAITIDIGVKIDPIAPTTGETIFKEFDELKDKTLESGYGWREISFRLPSSLPDGTYRLTLCFRLSGTEKWIPVLCESEYYNYVEFTKKGTKFTIMPNKKALPEIVDAEFLTPVFYGDAVKMSVTVKNPTGKELTNYFYPALYSGGFPELKGDGITITIAPGETVTKDFICMFDLMEGKTAPTEDKNYKLMFYDPTSADNTDSYLQFYPDFSKDVTMKINTGKIDLTINDFSIKGYSTYEKDNRTFYKVTDPSSIPFSISFTNNGDYFAKTVALVVFPYPYTEGEYNLAYEEFSPLALLTKGEQATLTANLDFYNSEIGKSYFAIPYINNEQYENFIFFTLAGDEGGVDGITSDESLLLAYDHSTCRLLLSGEASSVVITGMNGIAYDKTAEAAAGSVDLSNLPAGIYIAKAIAADGTVKILKIMK